MACVMARICASVNDPFSGEPSMSTSAEAYQLIPISQVGATLVILAFKATQIYQQLFWSRLARKWGNWHVVSILLLTNGYWETGHAFAFQMSAAYSAIVRSLENFPEPATFKIALRDHPAGVGIEVT